MFQSIKEYCENLTRSFDTISEERKSILKKTADYIQAKINENQQINLVYICTHNSRRSHFGQIWANVASSYYSVENVHTFSGGTEATAFHINAINSLKRIGFQISDDGKPQNPTHTVKFSDSEFSTCFSKVYDDETNPQSNFAAIMTCSDAEQNCPFIPGVELRIGTTYNDPKEFDNTPQQDSKYDERCQQIALETLYVFSLVARK